MKNTLFLISFIFSLQSMIQAQELSLPLLFSDHMVYQRNEPIKIWGWDKPGQDVTVSLNGFSEITTTNVDGYWQLFLPEQTAGGPFQLLISGSSEKPINDIYFGDVWVAGGQSNMEWKLSWLVDDWEEEVANSDYPEIRFFEVPKNISFKKESKLSGGDWRIANPQNSPEFSAVAWHFAKMNHLEKEVPVGIINSNWGGTPAESWVPVNMLLDVDGYKTKAIEMLDESIDWENRLAENQILSEEKYRRVEDDTEFLKYGSHHSAFDDTNWEEIELPNIEPLRDFVWLRKSFELDNIGDTRLSFGNPGKFSVVFINGKKVYKKIWSDDPKIISIDKSFLSEGENVIAIRTVEDWDNRTFIGKENEFWIETSNQKLSLEGAWKFSNSIEPPMPNTVRYEHTPGTLYNGMIHPLTNFPIQGVIWYQGESNVWVHQYYHELFSRVIESWRDAWNQDFSFLYVQLANFMERNDQPTESDWAKLREAQTLTLEVPKTGMAVTIDIGNADDIHPRNKKDVGYRLWQAAKNVTYNEGNVFSGPKYRSHEVVENVIEITFSYAENGWQNKNYDQIEGFTIAGSDSIFHWANAEIDKNKIRVFSDQVSAPIAVRYAWADNPIVSLYNREGLPVVPFRTDDW